MRRTLAVLSAALLVGVAQPALAAPGPTDAPEWWFDTWGVPALWDGGARGQGVTIAEIDTGVNAEWPELSNVIPGTDYGPNGGDGRKDRAADPFGHGTAMASIMVAHAGLLGITGLAPDAKLLPIAVPLKGTTDAAASGNDHLAAAIRWAADHGGKILSMSLGGSRDPNKDTVPCPADEQAAITYAIQKGAIVVASSGNSGQKGSPVEEPGVCLGVVSVGAVDSHGNVPSFSSRHRYLTVTAPGVNVPSLGRDIPKAYAGDGTSQATAITSAVLALIWSQYPTLSGRQVVARMLATLDHRTGKQDPAYGYGIVNAGRAINARVPANAPNPVYDALAPFLTTNSANTRALPTPRPAAAAKPPPGHFVVGKAPSGWSPRVWTALVVGLLGAVGLVVLAVFGTVRSRHFAALSGEGGRKWRSRRQNREIPPAPTYRDADGLVWHDLTAPRDEAE
ncbi:MAG TPA: S8 family serine peptidase [Jatrophihabitantaceae bacterium]